MTALCNIQVYNVLHWKSLQSLDQILGIDPNWLSWLTTCLHILPHISSNISFFARLFTLYMVHLRSRPCCKSAWRFRWILTRHLGFLVADLWGDRSRYILVRSNYHCQHVSNHQRKELSILKLLSQFSEEPGLLCAKWWYNLDGDSMFQSRFPCVVYPVETFPIESDWQIVFQLAWNHRIETLCIQLNRKTATSDNVLLF